MSDREADLDLVILSVVGTKDLGGKDLPPIACDPPYVGAAATRGQITGFG